MSKKEQFIAALPDADTERDENNETQKKALKIKLRKSLIVIIVLALFLVLLAFIILSVRFVISRYIIEQEKFSLAHLRYLLHFGQISATVFIYALPLALPIALALIWRQKGQYTVRLQKFIQYQFTVNGVATVFAFTGTVAIEDSPITFLQVIFINLVFGGLAAIALTITTNPGETYPLSSSNQPIVTRRVLLNIVGQAIYQAIILFTIVFCGERLFYIESGRYSPLYSPPSVHFTLVFNAFALMSIFNMINARKVFGERNVFQNIHKDFLFIGIFLVELVIQALTVQMGCEFLGTTPIYCEHWLWCIAFAAGGLLWQQVLDSIPCRQ